MRHHNHNDGHTEVRRNRRLVVSSWASVGNYDYGFYWYFYQDGSIEHEIKLTGIIQTKGVRDDEPSITAHRVAKNLAGPIHQHFFSVRLDLDIDGTNNSVYEVDSEPLPADQNPYNNAFRAVHTLIGSESESARTVNSHAARHWRVVNRFVWLRYWRWKSRGDRLGRARIDLETRRLIDRLAAENATWGVRRIAAELAVLGHPVSPTTVYRPSVTGPA